MALLKITKKDPFKIQDGTRLRLLRPGQEVEIADPDVVDTLRHLDWASPVGQAKPLAQLGVTELNPDPDWRLIKLTRASKEILELQPQRAAVVRDLGEVEAHKVLEDILGSEQRSKAVWKAIELYFNPPDEEPEG